ncbi:hypothetical protein L226DRAFT_255845 [Lentinus tigrinus ALCF2SS1-7]|uniref:uncharacterized protein n=1 Tax=Lentinus tigrinus ALCF2SS1-7 TaxID=1328758 RepID=UPI0011662875|nr:hypothetical protein L226DRAFT_255845 [Lentinus tigrinus ALCF2SS1-7]
MIFVGLPSDCGVRPTRRAALPDKCHSLALSSCRRVAGHAEAAKAQGVAPSLSMFNGYRAHAKSDGSTSLSRSAACPLPSHRHCASICGFLRTLVRAPRM